jgi:phage terminase small subunit
MGFGNKLTGQRHVHPATGLTPKEERFCREYVVDSNGTHAATRAGYAKNSAHVTASQKLNIPKIKNRIAVLQGRMAERLELSADRILQELMRQAFVDLRLLYDENGKLKLMSEWPDDAARAVNSIEHEDRRTGSGEDAETYRVVKIKTNDKNAALKMLGSHMKMFLERHELTGKDGGPLETKSRVTAVPMTREELIEELGKRGLPTTILDNQ